MANTRPIAASHNGAHYFFTGWRLIFRAGIKRYVILPLLANILLMGSTFWWLFSRLGEWIPALMSHIPSWLQWLNYLLWPVAVVSILLVFGYFFSTVTNLIAAPFCGLLSEQLEVSLTGKKLPDMGLVGMTKDLPRIFARECRKILYYLPRAIALLLLYLVPGIGQTIAPVLWFLFTAWMLAIQYCDYPFDNRKVSFSDMRQALRQHKIDNLQFGALVSLCTLIPILNLVILPVAVCGATAMWVDRYRHQFVTD
ncbi:sulfate transporter CysZ [Serratia microhaemolytica]|uniref:sulfate transporter CysZ n=1 Tax=Serratia microhaemolytica TaxID=2675110 RepID=UPI000FDE673D|nr:sulfate transporter CysZ [Serratia microhaemolytica]